MQDQHLAVLWGRRFRLPTPSCDSIPKAGKHPPIRRSLQKPW
jgi:hypothetical protein